MKQTHTWKKQKTRMSRLHLHKGRTNLKYLIWCLVLAFPVMLAGQVQAQTDPFTERATLNASDASGGDSFGLDSTIDGTTAIIGSRNRAAYIFEQDTQGNWNEVKKLPPGNGASSFFGFRVGLSGDIAIVGDFNAASGVAYVFERDANGPDAWGEVAKLVPSDAEFGIQFGFAVAVSGNTAIVGGRADNDNGGNSGSAYIFERDAQGNWNEVQKLLPSDGEANDFFGEGVAISGDTAIVGAPGFPFNNLNTEPGAAYIFERDAQGDWSEVQKLLPSNGDANEKFGFRVEISGSAAVIGAPTDAENGANSGSAYIFERDHGGPDNWGEVQRLLPSDGEAEDRFGRAVGLSGDTAVIGTLGDNDKGSGSGSAYIFERDADGPDTWGEVGKVTASDGDDDDQLGESVSISGDLIIAGAAFDEAHGGNSGSAYIFERTVIVLPELEHFLCYKTRAKQKVDVTLSDQFDSGRYRGSAAQFLCPAFDINGEGLSQPDIHLHAYKVRGPHDRRSAVEVTNSLGTYFYDTKKTATLLVPASLGQPGGPLPPLPDPTSNVDRYRCLKSVQTKDTPKFPRGITVQAEDAFGTRELRLLKPTNVCVATDMNGEGIKDPDTHLMCYKVRPKPKTQVNAVPATDEFGTHVMDLKGEAELCIPSEVL